jgi:tetratricopeptide (TPR) repeat protein
LRSAFSQAQRDENRVEMLRLGPRLLAFNPWHLPTLLALARACGEEGFEEAELRYLRGAFEAAPSDLEVNRQSGRSLARMRKFDEAIACWQRVEELTPGDEEAGRMLSSLPIERSRQRGEREKPIPEDDGSAPSPGKETKPDHETGEIDLSSLNVQVPIRIVEGSKARQQPEIKLTRVQQLEAAIRDYPSNPDYYVELIPMYLDLGREYDAERLLTKGKTSTDDIQVRQLWEDVTMLRMSKKIAVAQHQAAKERTEEAQEHLAALCSERDRFETEVFVSRSLREPKNAAIRYQLALRLRQAGKVEEACQCFAEALHDPAVKPAACYEMGECLQQLRKYPEALQQYRISAESALGPDQLDCKKRALYEAGKLAKRIKMTRLSQRYLAELLQLDSNYKNAAELLRELG